MLFVWMLLRFQSWYIQSVRRIKLGRAVLGLEMVDKEQARKDWQEKANLKHLYKVSAFFSFKYTIS